MGKEEFIEKLRQMGVNAEIIDGIPYLLGVGYLQGAKIVKEIGYNRTYGIRPK